MKSLVLTHRQWDAIYERIKKEYAAQPSVYLIRNCMRSTLGFTSREHRVYKDGTAHFDDWRDRRSEIHLDFYDESSKTWFVMRYINCD